MKSVADQNEQFQNIAQLIEAYQADGNPVISVDTKKKEYIGNFYRDGYLYTTHEILTFDHDFNSAAEGVIIPQPAEGAQDALQIHLEGGQRAPAGSLRAPSHGGSGGPPRRPRPPPLPRAAFALAPLSLWAGVLGLG